MFDGGRQGGASQMATRPAVLLEDGTVYRGQCVRRRGEATGEIVFNTEHDRDTRRS